MNTTLRTVRSYQVKQVILINAKITNVVKKDSDKE